MGPEEALGDYPDDALLTSAEIERALGQTLQDALDLSRWKGNGTLEAFLAHAHDYVTTTVLKEKSWRHKIQLEVLNRLSGFPDAPPLAGVYQVNGEDLRHAYCNHLLCGNVTAVNGACTGHDSLVASLISIGVSLVRYDGHMRSWRTMFLRHDYPLEEGDPIEGIREILDRRAGRSPEGPGAKNGRDNFTYLLRRGFMAAAERKALLQKCSTSWRIGHGIPAPLELLTGSGCPDLIDDILPVLERLFLQEKRWVFLLSPWSNHALSTLANALEENQVAIFQKGKPTLDIIMERGHFHSGYRRKVQDFAQRLGEAMVVGGFRTTHFAPGQVFMAHQDHALTGGIIVMADAALQPHRGFPLLLDIAALSARVGLGLEAFQSVIESAYAKAGAPGLFAAERLLV